MRPSFTADAAGSYVVRLVVRDGTHASAASTVTINAAAANVAPVAVAGPPQTVQVGSLVNLSGSGSSDANGDTLTYQWALTAKPTGSVAALSFNSTVSPSFVADVAGLYVATLVVSDGKLPSTPSVVSITASVPNVAPVANAGQPQSVQVGTAVRLDGTASSDANGDALVYQWAISSRPNGSAAVLVNATTPTPTFMADVAGSYVILLVVGDGSLVSAVASVTVSAIAIPQALQLLLYGGADGVTYLGCLTCNQFHLESVCNQFGTYGSQFAANSIWNQFGTYGSQFSSYSPWNQFSSSGPAIYGTDTLFYGYFTVNRFRSQRTQIQVAVATLERWLQTGNLANTRAFLCGS